MKVKIYYDKEDQIEQDYMGEPEHVDTWDLFFFKYSENDIILISRSQAGAGINISSISFISDIHNVKRIDIKEINEKLLEQIIGAIFR